MNPRVIANMNVQLLTLFTKEEIKQGIFQMGALKALGPDDFSTLLFQKNWDIVGKDVCATIHGYLN